MLDGDRGITYTEYLPEGSEVVAGKWWPERYTGKPLVSFEQKIAEGLGLGVGDDIVVNVLGRNITATIASLRTVEWRTLGINFVMVFSPNTFAGAPHTHLATVTFPNGADMARDAAILRETAKAFPAVTSLRVKDALEAFNDIVGQLVMAIRGASAIARRELARARRCARGRTPRPPLRRRDPQDPRRDAGTAAFRLRARIRRPRPGDGGVRPDRRHGGGLLRRHPRHEHGLRARILRRGPRRAACRRRRDHAGLAGTWRILGQKPAPYLRNL